MANIDSADSTKIDIDFTTSKGCAEFLRSQKLTIIVSTYQTGMVFLIQGGSGEQLSIEVLKIERPMGLCISQSSLYIGGKTKIWRFNNILPPNVTHEGADCLFVPHTTWMTADLDTHDIAIDRSGRLLFVNTLYGCLATTSENASFSPLWRPANLSELAPEDRCHLNGLAMKEGIPAFATAFSAADSKHAWREKRDGCGVLWDIQNNKQILMSLTMPHSPRWYGEQLWLLESGSGTFGRVDMQAKKLIPVARIPGYLRGLTFLNNMAFIGSSAPRADSVIIDSPLASELAKINREPRCGIYMLDMKSGQIAHTITVSGAVQELYDIAVIQGKTRAKWIAPDSEESEFTLNIGSQEKLFLPMQS